MSRYTLISRFLLNYYHIRKYYEQLVKYRKFPELFCNTLIILQLL